MKWFCERDGKEREKYTERWWDGRRRGGGRKLSVGQK